MIWGLGFWVGIELEIAMPVGKLATPTPQHSIYLVIYLIPIPPKVVNFPMGEPRLIEFMGFWVVRGLKARWGSFKMRGLGGFL